MNSDLVYKKKYLKYKSKYTALQQQQQQQGAGFGSLITGKGKFGWYLYLTNETAYQNLFDTDLGFPKQGITLDKTNMICKLLCEKHQGSSYIERSINLLKNESKIVNCCIDTSTIVTPQYFFKAQVNKATTNMYISGIKSNQSITGSGNTHWFIVDYDPSGNRISDLFPIQ
jgi:hypothetical protein